MKHTYGHLRTLTIALFAMAVISTIGACSGSVRAGGRLVVTWPVAAPLQGEAPVGRWACIDGSPEFASIASSNTASAPEACQVAGAYALELLADGTGRTLIQYHQEGQ